MHSAFIGQCIRNTLGGSKLPEYWPTLVSSFLIFTLIHQVIAPILSRTVAPVSYTAIRSRRTRNTWGVHFTSQCHVLVVVPVALWCIREQARDPEWDKRRERMFGWDERAAHVNAIACGYFLWDSLDAIINFTNIGYVIHGTRIPFKCPKQADRPFGSYYVTRCLLWEVSTFFLNNHWFLDKTNRTGSTLQLINGLCLLATFFGARIIFGILISLDFLVSALHEYKDLPFFYVLVSLISCFTLQGLNWYWYGSQSRLK
ncbi:TLC domain containing protein [Amanita muscaria]